MHTEFRTAMRGRRFRLRIFLLVSMLAVLSLHLWAQGSDDEDDDDEGSNGSFASLTLKYDERGKADATFMVFGDVQSPNGIEGQLEQALHCPAGSLVNPPPNQNLPRYLASRPLKDQERYREFAERYRRNTFEGACPAGMTRRGLLLSTDVPLQTLTAELKRVGVTTLSIHISYPNSKYSEQTPGIKRSGAEDSSEAARRAASDPYSRASYLVGTSAPSLQRIHLTFGLRGRDVVRAATLPVLFLISPILICLWMRRAALRDAKTDPTGAWFSYFRVLTWCGNCLVLIWMMGRTVREGVELIASYYTAAHTAGGVALQVGIMMLPPWIAFFICVLLSYRVYRQVRGEAWTRREFFLNQFLGIATQFLPLACFIAAIGMISVNGQASVALFAGVYVSYVVCKWLHVKYSGLHIEPLTVGELRDKVFEIAKKAAVEVRGVFIVPAGKSQMANAFASRNHMVMFTDYLLSRLKKREVAAIAAHEIAHIQRKHPAWMTAAFIVLIFSSQILYGILSSMVGFLHHALQVRQTAEGASTASGLALVVRYADKVLAFPELILILFIFALFLYHLHSQHLEYAADAGSVQFTGDPEAMITSLLKLSHLNQTPVQWDRATGSLLTHPSTLKRVERIARIGQVPKERLQELLKQCANPPEHSESEEAWGAGEQFKVAHPIDPVVTLRSASGELAIKKWALRLAVIGPSASIAWAIAHYHLQHRVAIFALGGAFCLGLYSAVGEWQETWFRERLKRRFIARLSLEGIAVRDRDVQMVLVSPHGAPRIYALGFSWDTGGLILSDDRLYYIGDQIRFALKRNQILSVRLGQGVPGWIAEPRTYVEWQAEPGALVQTWNLLPKDPCAAWGSKRQCIELKAELEHWKTHAEQYPEVGSLPGLSAPEVGEITNQKLKAVINFGRFLKVALFGQVLAIVVCVVANIPSPWFVCLVDLLAVVYSFSPFWFYRDSSDAQVITKTAEVLKVQEEAQTGD